MRNQKRLTAFVLAVVLSGVTATAGVVRPQTSAPQQQQAVAAGAFDRQRFDALRTEGFEALYNLDYEGARRRFQEMVKAFPDHPAGSQFLAASLWLRTLNESRRLQASLYNTEGFYKEKDDKADPKAVAEFRELTRQAKALCEARLKLNPKDTEALYYLGAVEGLKAAFAGAVERSFMSALRSGSAAVDRHRELVKLDPNYHDAEVTIGMYDYVVGGLPLLVKVGAAIGGIRGSKKKGLATLERVASEGRWARDDAKSLLIALYKREKRYADAYRNASELAAKYTRNYIFKMEAADALVSRAEVERARDPESAKKAEAEAFAIFESLLVAPARAAGREGGQTPPAPRPPRDLVHFSYGDALFVAGHAERAAKEFLAAAALPNVEPGLATRARLRAAQALDVAGKREDALAQYKAVLARANVFDSHEEAKRGLKEPFKPGRKAAEGSASGGPEEGAAKVESPN